MMRYKVLDHGEVEIVDCLASDQMVLRAMLVSTGKDTADLTTELWGEKHTIAERNHGRINFLMRDKHGTPFEQNCFIFRVKAPIFVLREWHRHRIGWSYNEQSGRYMELGNEWYIPSEVRTRVGKPGHYTYEPMNAESADGFTEQLWQTCLSSYQHYKIALKDGVAPEQARLLLHVNHFSSMYATCNARSLMNFLALRNASTAQWEIQQYAKILENIFAEKMPVTYKAFVNNGRVAP